MRFKQRVSSLTIRQAESVELLQRNASIASTKERLMNEKQKLDSVF